MNSTGSGKVPDPYAVSIILLAAYVIREPRRIVDNHMPASVPGDDISIQFVSVAEVLLHDLLNTSGKVLYSAADTLCPGDIYLLGINPGGHINGPGATTIGENLASFPGKTSNDYLDETWPRYTRRLQTHVIRLLTDLQYEARDVCASNVLFTRSPTQPSDKEFKPLADICWPVHAYVISTIRPRLIIVFGSMPFKYLWKRAGKPDQKKCPSGNSNRGRATFCRSFRTVYGDHETMIVGIPFLNVFPASPETIQFIKQH